MKKRGPARERKTPIRESPSARAKARRPDPTQGESREESVPPPEQALFEAREGIAARDELLAIVSHELRNPLNAITTQSHLLERFSNGDEHLNRTAEAIRGSARQMERIVNDLMDLASIQARRLSLNLETGDLRSPIESALDAFGAICSAKAVTIQCVLPDGPLRARFDHGRLLQVLENLLANAVRFTPAGGRIALEAERAADVVQVRIADTGPGIPPEEIATIFERFRRVERRGRRGLGLGLYISRSIIEGHGGRIWTESAAGEGGIFSFTVPSA